MLQRKMLREIRQNFGQFFSLFILVALATALYVGFMADPIGGNAAREAFHENAGLASVWMYGEGFGEKDLEAVRGLDFVESAQLRLQLAGSAPEQGGAEIDLYLEEENLVNRPQTMSGAEYDPSDPDGVWLNRNFAEAWNLSVGDSFTVSVDGVSFTKEIKGIVLSPEYEYMCASTDADTNFANIGYVFLSVDGFPLREYLEHLIGSGKITAADILGQEDLPAAVKLLLTLLGITREAPAEKLLELSRQVKDADLKEMVPYTQMVIRGHGGEAILDREEEIAAAVNNHYAVLVDASSLPGIYRLTAELEQHAGFSYVFMAVFLAIALLVIVTGMSRMVERQRVQIGTLNALGMKRWRISLHYISYSVLVALLGGLLGSLLGFFLLGRWIVSLFASWYVVPGWQAGADWTFGGIVAAAAVLSGLAAWLSCRKLLKVAPGEALRPAAPKSGRRTLFERLPFWEKLGFSARYNLRDISRYKLRAVMGIFGTGVGMMILTGTLAALTMMDSVYDWTFSKIQNFSYEALLAGDMKLSDADALARELDGELVMQAGIELAAKPNAVSREKSTQVLTVTEGKGLYRITDPKARVTELPEGTAAITYGLAKRMGVAVGDTVYWHIYEENTWYSSVIGVINRTPETAGITLLRKDLEEAGAKFLPTLLATDDEAVQTISRPGISTVYGVAELREIYEEQMSIIWALVAAMVIFSLVMIIAVLYNTGSLSFHERAKEFATLKVLGFSTGKIRGLLTRQNFWLSLIGIALGAPFGGVMLEAMMNSNGDNFDYFATVTPRDVLLAGLFVLGVSMAVSFLFNGKIRKLDMVETLKGAE